MSQRRLLTGPCVSTLESRALEAAADIAGTHPGSVLYLTRQDRPQRPTERRWESLGPSASLTIESLDEFVTTWYERDQFEGRVTHVDRPLLYRLVELGLEELGAGDNPLDPGDRLPRAGLVQEAEALFTELEFAGLLSPEAMADRLHDEGLPSYADHVGEFAASVESARRRLLSDRLPETYRTERIHHVVTAGTPLAEHRPAVDVVLVAGITHFDALEQDLLDRIAGEWPTIAVLPRQRPVTTGAASRVNDDSQSGAIATDDEEGPTPAAGDDVELTVHGRVSGVDTAVERTVEMYLDGGFAPDHVEPSASRQVDRQRLLSNLYRHLDQSPSIDRLDPTELDLEYAVASTPPTEIRAVARRIRRTLSDGVDPSDVGVVLPSPVTYAEQVRETFEQYDLPFSLDADVPFGDTALGRLVEALCRLSREPRRIDTVLEIVTNPLVGPTDESDVLPDQTALSRVARRVEATGLAPTLDHADDDDAAAVEALVDATTALADGPLGSLPDRLWSLLDRLGVSDTLAGDRQPASRLQARERRARERLDRILETVAMTGPVANTDRGNGVDRLERALSVTSVPFPSRGPEDDSVVVCPLTEAPAYDFDSVFVLGTTSSHFPTNQERSAFVRPIHEAHPDFERRDVAAEARYQLASVLAGDATIVLTRPERSVDGEPYVEADFVTELRRLIDVESITVELAGDDRHDRREPPGTGEDVQRSLAAIHGHVSTDRVRELVATATASGTFDERQHERMEAGLSCAAARADTVVTEYDGRLSPETIARVHGDDDREPYSPSRLETYAACGFKYYANQILDIEAPASLTREPDAGDRGSYIHDVLEHYYRSLQSHEGQPVDPGGDSVTRQDQLLAVALDRLDEAFAETPRTAFHEEWLVGVLAGLGSPSDNEYYGPPRETADGRPVARGLFYRFLEHEADEPAKTTARPSWFEARVGQPYDTGTPVSDEPTVVQTPAGAVPIHGLVDRVDTVPGTDPTQAVVRDYKTGTTIPSADDALLGLRFQLPLYALMIEDALNDLETVGAAYYQVAPPSSVSSRRGLLTSQEMVVYHGADDVDTPLVRHSYPHFESHDAFRTFLEKTTADRLGQLVAGIEAGLFHPTVLDPSDAGCRYCDYADVCDVRPHRRTETIEGLRDQDLPAYVPPVATGRDPEEVIEVN